MVSVLMLVERTDKNTAVVEQAAAAANRRNFPEIWDISLYICFLPMLRRRLDR